jgi:tetratricopeptide (TPR) repeat protein
LNSRRETAVALASIAQLYQVHRKLTEAKAQYQHALTIFSELADQVNVTKTLANLALIYQTEGDYEQANHLLEQALAGYRELKDQHGQAITLVNLARLYFLQSKLAHAQSVAFEARALAEAHGFEDQLERLEELVAQWENRQDKEQPGAH